MTLSAQIRSFLKYLELEQNTSQLTIKNYDHYLKRFLNFAGDINPSKIDLNLVKEYRLHLSSWLDPQSRKALKKVTQNYFLIALRAFLRYLEKIGIETLPYEQVELSKMEVRVLKILDEVHLRSLLEAPDTTKKDGIRDRGILEILFSTGLRVSELASLNRDTIDLDKREFGIVGKGGKERMLFISDCAASWLEKYLVVRKDTFKPLFIRFQGKVDMTNNGEGMRLTTRSIERIVEKYVKRLKLPVKATPQTLRHSFARDYLMSGADIKSVQEMLGLSHTSNAHLKDVQKALQLESR